MASSGDRAPPPARDSAARLETPETQQLRAKVHQYDHIKENLRSSAISKEIVVPESPELDPMSKRIQSAHSRLSVGPDSTTTAEEAQRIGYGARHEPPDGKREFRISTRKPSRQSILPQSSVLLTGRLAAGLALGLGISCCANCVTKLYRTEEDVSFSSNYPRSATLPSFEGARRHAPWQTLRRSRLVASA